MRNQGPGVTSSLPRYAGDGNSNRHLCQYKLQSNGDGNGDGNGEDDNGILTGEGDGVARVSRYPLSLGESRGVGRPGTWTVETRVPVPTRSSNRENVALRGLPVMMEQQHACVSHGSGRRTSTCGSSPAVPFPNPTSWFDGGI